LSTDASLTRLSRICAGVQDDILTKLAKIADLKVISRTSVMGYRGTRDLRQIGPQYRSGIGESGSTPFNGSTI